MHPRVAILIAACSIAILPASQTPGSPSLRFVPGSTVKVAQLIGDEDKERRQPTTSRTLTRYGIEGTDLGSSFEHDGRVYFLFGDTLSSAGGAPDTIGITDARDPESGLRLDFLTTTDQPGRRGAGRRGSAARGAPASGQHQYLAIRPPGVRMGAFEVPVSGISLDGRMYVVVSTDHSDDRTTDRSVLTTFRPPSTFEPGRTISQLPAGHFVKMSLHAEPSPIAGLPAGGPFVLMWGTGQYRKSDSYLAVVPASHFEDGKGTRFFSGLTPGGTPGWSEREADAVPVVRNGTLGDVSVTWCRPLGLWLMTYDSRAGGRPGIEFAYSRTPWGPWSEPQAIFDPRRDPGLGKFIHDPRGNPPDNLVGPVIGRGQANPAAVHGAGYAPYVVERWTKVDGGELSIYYVLSTWNPYVVVLMRSRLRVE